jgi:hypothetical protein
LTVICKQKSHVFFRQLAKLTPELAPTVVSEHETFDSVQQVLGHTTILWISCSKLWRHKFLQQLPNPIEFLSACHKLFGPDMSCELHTNMGRSTELKALLQGLALPSLVSISMYTFFLISPSAGKSQRAAHLSNFLWEVESQAPKAPTAILSKSRSLLHHVRGTLRCGGGTHKKYLGRFFPGCFCLH